VGAVELPVLLVVLLVSFVMMTHVFTFFELLSDIVKNHIPMSRVLSYHLFLTPRLIYDLAPVGVLTAVLVTFGVLTKNNEVTAIKACGSAYTSDRAGADRRIVSERQSVRVRSLLGSGGRPPPGPIRAEIKGRPGADVSASRSPLDLWAARSRLLLPVTSTLPSKSCSALTLRDRFGSLPFEASHLRRARALG